MTPDDDLAGLQYDCMTLLGDLDTLQHLVAQLTDTHQRGIGFLTPDARAAINAQVAADRRQRTTQPDRDTVGLDWLNRDRDVTPTGHVRAPGTVAAISVEADIYFTLHDLVKRTTSRLYRQAQVCILERVPVEPTATQLIAHLRVLVVLIDTTDVLHAMHRELARLKDDATRLVDGDDKTLLPDPCPHCGHRTLVVRWRDDLIRCDRDQHTGSYAPCRCPDPLCDCKTKPIAYRHTWHRNPAAAGNRRHTWAALNNLLTTRRAAN